MGQYCSYHKEPTMGWSQSSSIHPPDLAGSLEIERLRAEHKMELDKMSSTIKTALALKDRKIKDLVAELKKVQSRGMNEEREGNIVGRVFRDEMTQTRVASLPAATALQSASRSDEERFENREGRSWCSSLFLFLVFSVFATIAIVGLGCLLMYIIVRLISRIAD